MKIPTKIKNWKVVLGTAFVSYYLVVGLLEYSEAESRASRSYLPPLRAQDFFSRPIGTVSQFRTPYLREDWAHWQDFDGDCQNTRGELLLSRSLSEVTFRDASNCAINTGEWVDPYTEKLFTMASDVDIDHVIPLSYAHEHGGASWSRLLKQVFANDSENLLIVQDNVNQSKGAKGPSEYLPIESYQCEYAQKWNFLIGKYELILDIKDSSVIRRILLECN